MIVILNRLKRYLKGADISTSTSSGAPKKGGAKIEGKGKKN
ncbi:MAG: hypothetical protein ABIM54_00885 [candidate division WOR-3 bacterium]